MKIGFAIKNLSSNEYYSGSINGKVVSTDNPRLFCLFLSEESASNTAIRISEWGYVTIVKIYYK